MTDAYDYFKSHGRDEQLLDIAAAELKFLNLIDKYPSLYDGPILQNAIRRYECFWLPLVAKESEKGKERGKNKDDDFSLLTAPVDVAWIWHLHMLSPLAYKHDCQSLFGRLLDSEYFARNHSVGRQLWQQYYPEEPFEIDLTNHPQYVPQYKSELKYNLYSAAARQSKFYYNVSLPHYRDVAFLRSAVERYKHHLDLKKANPTTFLVPCYDFDLIWHAHQLSPMKYHDDMTALLGYVLDHNDTETGRVPGSKLYDSEVLTREAWTEAGFSFSKRGAMYRGEPPPKFPPRQPGIFNSLATLDYRVELMKIDTHLNKKKKFQIAIKFDDAAGTEVKKIVKGGEMFFGNSNSPVCFLTLNSGKDSNITTTLYHKRLFGKKALQHAETSLKPFLNSLEISSQPFPVQNTTTITFNEGTVELTFRIVMPPTISGFRFVAVPEPNFTKVNHVAQVLSQPSLMLSPKNIETTSLPGEMTINQIRDHRSQVVFTCKIVHSAECMLSAVEILDVYNNLVATAHVLDIGALPEAYEVSDEGKNCVTVAGKEGARAMLIRSRDEDYGICVGKWVKKEIRGRAGRKKDISFMGVKFYSLNEDSQGWCKVKKLKNSKFLIMLRPSSSSQVQVKVDLNEGVISIPPCGVEDIPQCLAVCFAVAVLHLLCRPYAPKVNQSSAPLSRKKKVDSAVVGTTGTKVRRRSLSNSSYILYATPGMMLATGYCCMTVPTNVYLMYHIGHVGWDFCPDYYDTTDLEEMDCDGDWGSSIGFNEQGDEWENNASVGSFGNDFDGHDDWGDGNVDYGEEFVGFDGGGGAWGGDAGGCGGDAGGCGGGSGGGCSGGGGSGGGCSGGGCSGCGD